MSKYVKTSFKCYPKCLRIVSPKTALICSALRKIGCLLDQIICELSMPAQKFLKMNCRVYKQKNLNDFPKIIIAVHAGSMGRDM